MAATPKRHQLTPQQRKLILQMTDGKLFCTHYINPNSIRYYRLLTPDRRPMGNVRCRIINKLLYYSYLEKDKKTGTVTVSAEVHITPKRKIYLRQKE